MSTLVTKLADVDREIVIGDTVYLIDEEVAKKTGVMGLALKGGYKVVKKLKGGRMIPIAVDKLLDEFSDALSPLYDDYLESNIDGFHTFLEENGDDAADALLGITDAKAKKADSKVITKTYGKLRKTAKGHVVDALPGVGRMIEKHCPRES